MPEGGILLLCDFLVSPPHLMWCKNRIVCYVGTIVDENLSGVKIFVEAVAGDGGVVHPWAPVNLRQRKSSEKAAEIANGTAM